VNTKKFTTTEQCDNRFVWLDKEIAICDTKAADTTDPNREKFRSRTNDLRHEKRLLEKHRQFLLTPQLI
jgi:hypothetical protein